MAPINPPNKTPVYKIVVNARRNNDLLYCQKPFKVFLRKKGKKATNKCDAKA